MSIKIGDEVFFKNDVEGTGYVVEIITRRNGRKIYKIANKRRDCSPWHIMAQFDHEHMCSVVTCDEYQVEAF